MRASSNPAHEHSMTQTSTNVLHQLAEFNARNGSASILANANNVNIKDSTFMIVNKTAKSPLDALYQLVAPNAILNKGGRADDAKCHPGTREEVIGLIERWMDNANIERIFWMSGPAGGGKTAIMKTVAERSADRVLTINFFFFRGDSTRDSARPVVATLLYQLFQLYPPSVEIIANIFSKRPRILDESLEEQCKLISALFPVIQQSLSPSDAIVLLIDGLDECDFEAERSQPAILHAFERLVNQADSPFRLLVASRREAQIQMTFNELPSHARSIFLDEEYSPDNDIRTFVQAEFYRIKASHPNKRSLPAKWPSSSDVELIVTKSSGQFIYAATVTRHISDPFTVPSLSLQSVMGIVPTVNNSPFANLDHIYIYILNRASDSNATRDILSVKLLGLSEGGIRSHTDILQCFNERYSPALIESCLAKLSAIAQLNEDGDIELHHASLADFLLDQARSGRHCIDIDAFRAHLLVVVWRNNLVGEGLDYPLLTLITELFHDLQTTTSELTHMLLHQSVDWMWTDNDYMPHSPFVVIRKLYYHNDVQAYKGILRQIVLMAISRGGNIDVGNDIPHLEEYCVLYGVENFW